MLMPDAPAFRWRSIALPALLPTLLFSIGEGAIIPVIPLVASSQGAGLALAGLIAAALTVGELIGNIPSGWLIARTGERPAMIGAGLLALVAVVLCAFAVNPVMLGVGVLLLGLAASTFALARHAFLTSFVPMTHRARALSTLGGTFRLGFVVGPFITAAVIQLTGIAQHAFFISVVACIGAVLILMLLPDPAETFGKVHTARVDGRVMRDGESELEQESRGLFATLRRKRAVLLRMGAGAAMVSALRSSRQVILPLWAVSIGVGDTQTALVIGIASAVDFALFYTGGAIMDRFGRLATALPSILGLGLGHLVLAVTHDVTNATLWFVVAAMVLALANGIGSGILMTLGSDLSDPHDPATFLGAWRFTTNLGGATAPLLIAGITAVASLSVAAGTMAGVALLGAVVIVRYLPRYSPRRPRG